MVTGTAYLYPNDAQIVPAAIRLTFPPTSGLHQFNNLPVTAFAPAFGQPINRQQMAVLYPMSDVSDTADATLSFVKGNIFVTFNSALTSGFGNLIKAHTNPSGLQPLIMPSWNAFREWLFDWPGKIPDRIRLQEPSQRR